MGPTRLVFALLLVCTGTAASLARAEGAAAPALDPELAARASVGGKYAGLLRMVSMPEDAQRYGQYRDYGRWEGGTYNGVAGLPAGYWVWVAPNWYIWSQLANPSAAPPVASEPEERNRPESNGRPRPPPPPSPYDPVYRYAKEKNLKVDQGPAPEQPASGALPSIVRPAGGGFVFGAIRDDRTQADRELRDRDGYRVYVTGKQFPFLIRLDDQGQLVWERSLKKKGFAEYALPSLAQSKDGQLIAMVPSYVHPARWPVARFVKVNGATGAVLWERQLRGSGDVNSPVVRSVRLDERGGLELRGGIKISAKGEVNRLWRGAIGADGKLLADMVGPIAPAAGDGPLVSDPTRDGTENWLRDRVAMGADPYRPAYLYALDHHVRLAYRHKHIAPNLGWMIPVIELSRGGGYLVVGVSDAKPVVVKLDSAGKLEWQKTFEQPGFDAYGGGLALEAPDGDALVMIPSYRTERFGYVPRFLKIGRAGEIRWERSLQVVKGAGRAPEVEKARLSEKGTLALRGFAYMDASFLQLRLWDGELDMAGTLVVDKLGGERPPPGTMQVINAEEQ